MIEVACWWVVRRGRPPSSVAPTRLGAFGEWLASRCYRRRGFEVVSRNRRIGGLEIDLVVRRRRSGATVLVEVKSSTTSASGLRRIDRRRIRRMVAAAARLEHRGPIELHAAEVDLSRGRPRVRVIEITPMDRGRARFSDRGSGLRRS